MGSISCRIWLFFFTSSSKPSIALLMRTVEKEELWLYSVRHWLLYTPFSYSDWSIYITCPFWRHLRSLFVRVFHALGTKLLMFFVHIYIMHFMYTKILVFLCTSDIRALVSFVHPRHLRNCVICTLVTFVHSLFFHILITFAYLLLSCI